MAQKKNKITDTDNEKNINDKNINNESAESEIKNNQNTKEHIEKEEIIKKSEESKTKAQNLELISEDEEDSLIDDNEGLAEDNDFIWVIQRVVWGTLKTISTIIIIILVIWFIWHPDKNFLQKISSFDFSSESTSNTPEPTANNTSINTPKVDISEINNPVNITTDLNLFLEQQRLNESQQIIEHSLLWCRQAAAIFDLNMPTYFANQTRAQRIDKLKNLLLKIDQLRTEAKSLRRTLNLEINDKTQKMTTSDQDVTKYGNMFLNSVQTYEPVNVNYYLEQKITAEQTYFKYKNEIRAREIIIEKISKIEEYLTQYREIMIANQKAIIEDVQVVNFPSDPFNQVLTPTEWRDGQQSSSQK